MWALPGEESLLTLTCWSGGSLEKKKNEEGGIIFKKTNSDDNFIKTYIFVYLNCSLLLHFQSLKTIYVRQKSFHCDGLATVPYKQVPLYSFWAWESRSFVLLFSRHLMSFVNVFPQVFINSYWTEHSTFPLRKRGIEINL